MKKLLLLMIVFLTTTITFAQSNYQDVVYLKNGSIIRGTIIEQVPNESLKIETADGSLFVYKIDDVEKMTKERVSTQTQQTTTPQAVSQTQNATPVQQQKPVAQQPVQQEQTLNRYTQWGVKGGFNIAQQTVDTESTGARLGIHIGFFVEVPVSSKVFFQPELMYSMQGCSYKSGSTNYTEKWDYINLPLIFKFYVWQQRLSVDAGPQLGYLISAKYSADGKTTSVYDNDWVKKFDVSIGVGVSYKLTDNFDLAWRVNVGVTNLSDKSEHKNSVFQLTVGYRF